MRRNRDSKLRVDMFPFLSVLCTVIGVMMLLIVLVVSTRAEKVEQQQSKSPTSLGEHDTASDEISEEQFAELTSEIARLKQTLAQRQEEHVEIEKQLLHLEEALAQKEDLLINIKDPDSLVPGIDLDPPEHVELVPAEEAEVITKYARFVELRATEIIAHPNAAHPETLKFRASEVGQSNSRLSQFLDDVDRRRESEYLLLLIHPNGVDVYRDLMEHIVTKYPGGPDLPSRIDIGKEPFHDDWLLINYRGN